MKHDMQTPSVIGAVLPLLGAFLLASAAAAPATDEKTNAPAATIQWNHSDYKEPSNVWPLVEWDDLPVSEVVKILREKFHNEFDVLVPSQLPSGVDPTTGLPVFAEGIDPGGFGIKLRLQNVRASEIFNAMNLLFEANQTPVRWELLMNGHRPTAVLRPLPPPKTDVPPRPQEQAKRSVFFVGDIVGNERAGGMNWDQFYRTIDEVCDRVYRNGSAPKVEVHRDATLLIVTGNQEQIDFVRNMLEALKEKAKLETVRKAQSKPAEPQQKPAEAKAP